MKIEGKGNDGYVNRPARGIVNVPAALRDRAERNVRRRRTVNLLVGLLVPAIVLTVFLSVICDARSLGTDSVGNTDGAYGVVLSNIEGLTEANPRIVDIAMLGAHDANTFSLATDNGVDHIAADGILGKIFPVSAGLQYRFAVTQAVSPYTLLMQGARFLQFKFSLENGVWRAAHTVLGRELEKDVLDVLRFLDEHPGEVVLLLFQCTNEEENNADCPLFDEWLAGVEYKGKNLYDYAEIYVGDDALADDGSLSETRTDITDLTYNDVTDGGKQAGIVLLQRYAELYGKNEYTRYFYDMDANALHRWHSRIGCSVLIDEIDDYATDLTEMRAYRFGLRVNQTQAAFSGATFGDILRDIGEWSLLKFASKYNVELLENENFSDWLKAMPIFQVDFANSDYGDFNNRVNGAIRARNEEIVRILLGEGATVADLYE